MKLTGKHVHDLIAERKEKQARVRTELHAGELRNPPPLLIGLEPVSAILPRLKLSAAQKRRNTQDAITTLERMLRNQQLEPKERQRLEQQLSRLRSKSTSREEDQSST